jgi:hypothetical protein
MATVHKGQVWRLSPSDLFVYGSCRRCFWLKAVHGLPRPRGTFPKVFGLLDRQTKDFLCRQRAEEMAAGLPSGRVLCRDRMVRSAALEVPGHEDRVRLVGRLDTALALDEGGHAIIDFKTTTPRPERTWIYSDQLIAYAIALENADIGALSIEHVSRLGLVCVEPQEMVALEAGVAFRSATTWLEIQRDDQRFWDLLAQVLLVLGLKESPEAAPGCPYCAYQVGALRLLLEQLQGDS